MDLNADGVIGLQDGQVARELTDDEQSEVDNLVSIEKDNIAEAPVEPKEPSRAFQMARALNPDTSVSEQMQDELEPIQNPTAERVAEAKGCPTARPAGEAANQKDGLHAHQGNICTHLHR